MKEIKFRAWDKARNKMLTKNHEFKILPEYGAAKQDQYGDVYKTKDITLMQFTGLYDKNNKEIYEGDIILHGSTQDMIDVVLFCDGYYYTSKSSYLIGECSNAEVIGNIFESTFTELYSDSTEEQYD